MRDMIGVLSNVQDAERDGMTGLIAQGAVVDDVEEQNVDRRVASNVENGDGGEGEKMSLKNAVE